MGLGVYKPIDTGFSVLKTEKYPCQKGPQNAQDAVETRRRPNDTPYSDTGL